MYLQTHAQPQNKDKPIFKPIFFKILVFTNTLISRSAAMKEYYYKRSHVAAFGSSDCNESLPFTECFESAARQTGLLRYSYSESEDRDLYVTGDLYDNDVVTSAIIVVPRTKAKVRDLKDKETKRKRFSPTPKPVDDDLYKISPEFLYTKVKKRRGLCFFCGCFLPTCIA